MNKHLIGLLILVLVVAGLWLATRKPSCASAANRAWDEIGLWHKIVRGEGAWTPPTWATDVRVIECRDGNVYTWYGDAPPNTTDLAPERRHE